MMSIEVGSVCALLQVFDMPASVRFYRDVLGFEIVETSSREGDQFDWGMAPAQQCEPDAEYGLRAGVSTGSTGRRASRSAS